MTDAPRKRPWLQFHLSTLIALTFVAAGLLWLNMRVRGESTRYAPLVARVYGYPAPFLYPTMEQLGDGREVFYSMWVDWPKLFINVGLWLACLFFVHRFCEWRIRRQERGP